MHQRIKHELKLSHVAAQVSTEGPEFADRMGILDAQLREKRLRLYREEMDIPMLLKMRVV